MASTKVTFKRGLKSDINSVPIKDGQLIVTKDTGELYADVPLNGQIIRKLIGDGAGIVDQIYNPNSINAQSGTAVAEAITVYTGDDPDNIISPVEGNIYFYIGSVHSEGWKNGDILIYKDSNEWQLFNNINIIEFTNTEIENIWNEVFQ